MKTNRLIWVLLASGMFAQQAASYGAILSQRASNSPFDDLIPHLTAEGKTDRSPRGETIEKAKAKAAKGDSDAQLYLAVQCYFGIGTNQNYAAAVKWYRKAAEQGDSIAQRSLGVCYERGQGVPQDYEEAVNWYRKAAEHGEMVAQNNLGASFREGLGIYKYYPFAVRWFRKAAEQGLTEAQINLTLSYARGEGVTQDFVEAYKWANIAATSGNTNAALFREEIRLQMTPEQVAEAQQLAREFKPRTAPDSGSSKSGKEIADSNPSASGTGFFISEDGFLVTNEHVVRDASQVRLVTRNGLISAKVVKVDAANDLALLKTEGRFVALPIASSREVKLGGTVVTVGFPNIGLQGFAPKLAKGEIAALSGASDDARYFQISVPVQPGNSGGALVDEHGNVVGVVSAKLDASAAFKTSGALPENVNYAVKSSYLLSFLESVPEVSAKLKEPQIKDQKFEDVVKEAEQASVLVLVY
jgi:uncharacterized protein